jgi:hypothetical protein
MDETDERSQRCHFILDHERWHYDSTYSNLHGPGCVVYIPRARRVEWLAVTPSKRLALLSTHNEAIVVDLESRVMRTRFRWRGPLGGAWISDEDLIVWGERGIRWLSVSTDRLTEHARGPKRCARLAAPSRDGTRVAAVDELGALSIVTRESAWTIDWHEPLDHSCKLAWSSDARRLAIVHVDASVYLLDVEHAIAASEARASLNKPSRSRAAKRG